MLFVGFEVIQKFAFGKLFVSSYPIIPLGIWESLCFRVGLEDVSVVSIC